MLTSLRPYLKPFAAGILGALLAWGIVYYGGKAHYYLKVVWTVEKILTAQGVKF